MDPKLLTESAWKTVASKSKVKDNGLQRALASYEKLDDKEHDERLKTIASVSQLATALKKVKEVAAIPDVVDYLVDLLSAVDASKAEIAKAKAAAEKAQAVAQKKAESEAKDNEQQEEEDDQEGEYDVKLLAAFQKLRGVKGVAYQFIVCDAKPHCGLMVAKKITPKHKEELTKVTGSKRFLHLGTCQFENGHFVFSLEQPVSGLARKLQDSIKNFTGKKLPILVGTESAEDDDEGHASSGAPAQVSTARAERPELAKASELWHQTLSGIAANVDQLKAAIRKELAEEDAQVVARVEAMLKTFDGAVRKLDDKLAEALVKAHSAEPAARQAALQNAKTMLGNQIQLVKAEPLFAHMDANTFGVTTNLQKNLHDCFTQIAKALS